MRLADFILANTEPILVEWESFARSIWPHGVTADPADVRDEAEGILRATAADMQSDQTGAQQAEKSKGASRAWDAGGGLTQASSSHGTGREASGFELWAVIAEYRALRASVLRLWRESGPAPDLRDVDDVTRFSEAKQGIAIGRAVAEAVLLWRQNDGWPATIVPDPNYVLPATPGNWQPTPPANSFATFTFFPKATPFGIQTSTQFLPPSPPVLTSERYATDFNEVKSLGLATSAVRTAEQTEIALRIAAVGFSTPPVEVFFRVAEDVARTQGLSLVDTARLFAFVSVAHHDGLQTSFTSKFVYGLWRPVTAIQRADEDGNALTDPDPEWLPLLITPPYPTYAGNASCLAAAAARALQLALGTDEVPFSVTWVGIAPNPDVTRDYDRFSVLAEEFARSRIYGGIHFQFDSDASQAACPRVSEYVHANYMVER